MPLIEWFLCSAVILGTGLVLVAVTVSRGW